MSSTNPGQVEPQSANIFRRFYTYDPESCNCGGCKFTRGEYMGDIKDLTIDAGMYSSVDPECPVDIIEPHFDAGNLFEDYSFKLLPDGVGNVIVDFYESFMFIASEGNHVVDIEWRGDRDLFCELRLPIVLKADSFALVRLQYGVFSVDSVDFRVQKHGDFGFLVGVRQGYSFCITSLVYDDVGMLKYLNAIRGELPSDDELRFVDRDLAVLLVSGKYTIDCHIERMPEEIGTRLSEMRRNLNVLRPQSGKGSLNQKGLGSKLCREDRAIRRRTLSVEERVALDKSPKRVRKEERENARERKQHRQFPFHPQSGWSILPSFKTEHKHTIDLDQEMKEKMEAVWSALHQGTSHPILKVNHCLVNPLGEGLTELGPILKSFSLISFCVCLYMRAKDPSNKKWSAGCFFSGMMVGSWLPANIAKLVDEKNNDLKPQIDSGDIGKYAGILFIGLSYLTMGEASDPKSFERIVTKTCMFDRAKTGLTEVFTLVVDLAEKAINYIRVNMFGLDKISIISKDLPGLKKWCDEVEMIIELSRKGDLLLNTETSATVFRLEREGRSFETLKMSSSDAMQVRSAISSYKQALRSIVARFENASLHGNGVRMEPVALLCVGDTSVGKSTKADPLLRKMIYRVLDVNERKNLIKNFNDYVYGYYPELVYMDNYRQQFAVYLDDYGQAVDVPGNLDNEHMKILRMVNTVPYTCHMADIGSKGNTPFTSKVIYATSNLTRIRPSSVYKPEAIARRFTLIFRCVVKAEFAINPDASASERKLNTDHEVLTGPEYFDNLHEYEIMRVDPGGTLTPTGEKLTEEELVERFATIYKKRKDFFDKYTKYIAKDLWESEDKKIDDLKPQSDIMMHEVGEELPSIRMNLGPIDYIAEVYSPEDFGLSAVDVFSIIMADEFTHHWLREYTLGHFSVCDEIWYEFLEQDGMREHTNIRVIINNSIYNFWKKAKDESQLKLDNVISRVKCNIENLAEKYPMLFQIGKLVTVAGVLFSMYKLYNSMFRCDKEKLETEGYSARKPGKLKAKKPSGVRSGALQPEASRDPNSDQIALKVVKKSQYSITISGDEGRMGLGMFVGGRVFLMPLHYVKHIEAMIVEKVVHEGDFIVLHNEYTQNGSFKVPIRIFLDPKNRIDFEDRDFCFVHLDTVAHHFNNGHLFITKEQRDKPLDLWCSLVGIDRHNHKDVFLFRPTVEEKAEVVSEFCDDYKVSHGYRYMSQIGPGDCGYIMLISNLSVGPGKIMGMHIAGSDNGCGFACSITKEDVDVAMEKWKEIDYPPPAELLLKPQCMELPFKGDFIPICYTEKNVSQPVKTKYEPSPITGVLGPVDRFPAILKNVDGIDPLAKAIEQYGREKKSINLKILKKAVSMLARKYRRVWKTFRKPRVYTFEEACKGISEVEFANAIPRNTSAGYPYVMDPKPGFRGKEWYFGQGELYDFTRPQAIELKAQVEEIIEKAKRGERSLFVCVDTKKDELRKQSKIDKVETRLISAGALAATIVCRMYTLDFSIFTMERNLQVGVGVGINPYSEDWNMLANLLMSKGKNLVAGDYTGFDSNCIAVVYRELVELINEFYGKCEIDNRIRRVLFADLYNSLHIFKNIIYMWLACMPSGHPLTAILNSLYNQVNIRYTFVLRGLHEEYEYDEEIAETVYGDDIVLNISDKIIDKFNMNTLTEDLKSIGFTFTDDMKSDSVVPFRTLTEITYLKRYFRFEPLLKRYVAPLEFSSIKKSLDWVKRGPSSLEFCKSNVDNALVEFSLHKKEDFQRWAPVVVEASREVLHHEPREIERYELLKFSAKIDQWM